jgi:hypothetical protein
MFRSYPMMAMRHNLLLNIELVQVSNNSTIVICYMVVYTFRVMKFRAARIWKKRVDSFAESSL